MTNKNHNKEMYVAKDIKTCLCNWWLVRVTLVVDWLFLPQNFGPVVGTYEGLLPFCECTWGGGFYVQVVGTPDHYMW